MGFLANAAARSEMKVRDTALEMLREIRPDFVSGNVLLPCHIVEEVHNGFFVNTGAITVGIFRCQLHWWGHELEEDTLAGLTSPNSARWLSEVRMTPPQDMGTLRGGIPEFVAGLAFGLPVLDQRSLPGTTDELHSDAVRVPLPPLSQQVKKLQRLASERLPLVETEPVYLQSEGGWALKFRVGEYDWNWLLFDGYGWFDGDNWIGYEEQRSARMTVEEAVIDLAWLVVLGLIGEIRGGEVPSHLVGRLNEVVDYLVSVRDSDSREKYAVRARQRLSYAAVLMREKM